MKLHVKVEIFRPKRIELKGLKFWVLVEGSTTVADAVKEANERIEELLPTIRGSYPNAKEIRWEFVEYGQGHYINLDADWISTIDDIIGHKQECPGCGTLMVRKHAQHACPDCMEKVAWDLI